ncbi:MAG: class II histone deacetylase [Alphaproteobacteria bacterium]
MSTGFVWHELYMWHDTGGYALYRHPGLDVEPYQHAENPDTKRRFRNVLEVAGLWDDLVPIKPRQATVAEITRFHDADYVERIRTLSAKAGGEAGDNTPFGRGSYEIAALGAGGVIEAVDAVLAGKVDNAYALVRPPGHHAEANRGRGFCIFGNAALAALHAMAERGINRIATVDWDTHHGNGTQSAFWTDPRVLTMSLHQDRCFPTDSGMVEENGADAGAGTNINIPLPPGSGVGAYVSAFERVVIPALEKFKPELIIVPSGFDAGGYDPLGRQMLHSDGYREMTAMLLDAAARLCDGRLVLCHEGGYSAATLPYMGMAVMETLLGRRGTLEDPFLPALQAMGQQALQPHQTQTIDHCVALLDRIP